MNARFLTGPSLLATLLLAAPALAHEVVRDGNVGALLHIEPADAPTVGKPNTTWFDTHQRGGKAITLANCTCAVSIYSGSVKPGAKPVSSPVLRTEKNRLTADLVFARQGAYTIVLTGKPKAGATFNAFRLQWVVRADLPGAPADHQH